MAARGEREYAPPDPRRQREAPRWPADRREERDVGDEEQRPHPERGPRAEQRGIVARRLVGVGRRELKDLRRRNAAKRRDREREGDEDDPCIDGGRRDRV